VLFAPSFSADTFLTSNTLSIKFLGFLSGVVEISGFLGFGTTWLDDWRPTFRDNCGLETTGTYRPMTQHDVAEERRLQRNKYGDKIFEIRVKNRLASFLHIVRLKPFTNFSLSSF
jgi:hypothetical protein